MWAFCYGRGTPQFGTLGSHTGLLACGGIASHSIVCLMAPADTNSGRPFPARLPTGCNGRPSTRFFRRHSRSLPGHTGPHLTHSWRGILVVRRSTRWIERTVFSASRRTASAHSVGSSGAVGGALDSGAVARRRIDRRTFPAAFASAQG